MKRWWFPLMRTSGKWTINKWNMLELFVPKRIVRVYAQNLVGREYDAASKKWVEVRTPMLNEDESAAREWMGDDIPCWPLEQQEQAHSLACAMNCLTSMLNGLSFEPMMEPHASPAEMASFFRCVSRLCDETATELEQK